MMKSKNTIITVSAIIIFTAVVCTSVYNKKKNLIAPLVISKNFECLPNSIDTGTPSKNISEEKKCSLGLPDSIKENVPKDMQYTVLLQLILNLIKSDYVLEMSDRELTEKAVSGLLSSLDAHSCYLDEESMTQYEDINDGEFGGLGIEIVSDEGFIRIISPIDDTPAYKAGLKSGDLIIYVDDECINGLKSDEVIRKLRGKPKTKVKLKIKRENKDPFDVEIVRDIIKIQPIKSEYLNDICYVRISTFCKNTATDLKKVISELVEKNKKEKIKGIVLDLRNNLGGLLEESIEVSNLFLDEGKTIVSSKGRTEDNSQIFKSKGNDLTNNIPLVVIINNATVSAAEIVAGALRDNNRALLVGTRTYGKGSVQKIFPLSQKSALKLTVSRYYTPSEESIQANGISPDIEVDHAIIEKLDKSFIVREEFFRNALDADKKSKNKKLADEMNKKSLDALMDKKDKSEKDEKEDRELLYRKMDLKERIKYDYQLEKAFDVIKTIDVYQSLKNLENEKTKEDKNGNEKNK